MKYSPTAIFGFLSCLCLVLVYGWLVQAGLKKPPVNLAKVKESAVTADTILTDNFFAQLQVRNTNGPLPITVEPNELGTTNPF